MDDHTETVAEVTLSCVRELLAKRGFKRALAVLDEECPRTSASISKRSELAKVLGVEKLMAQNKERDSPYKSMLEVMSGYFVAKKAAKASKSASSNPLNTTTALSPAPVPRPTKRRGRQAAPAKHSDDDSDNETPSVSIRSTGNTWGSAYSGRSSTNSRSLAQPSNTARKDDIEDMSMMIEDIDFNAPHPSRSSGGKPVPMSRRSPGSAGTALSPATIRSLKALLFPSSIPTFNECWIAQSFVFGQDFAYTGAPKELSAELRYGLLQGEGGPCGVVAAVQAELLSELIGDTGVAKAVDILHVSDTPRKNALIKALSRIIWRAGLQQSAQVVLRSGTGPFSGEEALSALTSWQVSSISKLEEFIREHISSFEAPNNLGCILLVISVILTKTIAVVKSEMDIAESHLIGEHSFCTMELVNLLLLGRAISNQFDGDKAIDGMTLKGISAYPRVGILSLMDYLGYAPVGEKMKSPTTPVWIIYAENHYSVLFSTETVAIRPRVQTEFDVYYYDPLGKQDESYRITVDPTASEQRQGDELVSSVDHCIRTKWKNASVDWHGKVGGF